MRGQQSRHQQILTLLRSRVGEWVSWQDMAAAGGGQYNARILELRAQGHKIEQRGGGVNSEYRLSGERGPEYESFECRCGWSGKEPQAIRRPDGGYLCPQCQGALGEVQATLL